MIEPMSLALALLLSTQAAGDEQSAQQAAQEPVSEAATPEQASLGKVADEDDKIICRRTSVIGSKFKKKICGTKKQWETLENRSEQSTQIWQRRGKGLEPEDSNKISPGGF